MQVLNIFGDGQNCQNQTFKWLYQLYKSKYQKSFFGKIFTVMLFHMYQVFSSLLGHLHFSLHFFSTFMEQLFNNHPISLCCRGLASPPVPSGAAAQKGEMKGRKLILFTCRGKGARLRKIKQPTNTVTTIKQVWLQMAQLDLPMTKKRFK